MGKCKDCRFYEHQEMNDEFEGEIGTCRRNAPQVIMQNGTEDMSPMMISRVEAITSMSTWPTVPGNEWCGEWKPKPKEGEE